MGYVHLVIQKKGGVGKSLVASMWTQFLIEQGFPVKGYDTDPSNSTFSEFAELGVSRLNLLDENEEINPRRFDILMDAVMELGPSEQIVVDTGSSCYVSLLAYLKQNQALDIVEENGHKIFLQVPITGGSDILHTVACLDELVAAFSSPVILWKNFYHGDLAYEGKKFSEFKSYDRIRPSLAGEIDIPVKHTATFGKDIEILMAKKMTFRTARKSNMSLMSRQRLSVFWNEITESMKLALRSAAPEAVPDRPPAAMPEKPGDEDPKKEKAPKPA
jgi:hypothetical protein